MNVIVKASGLTEESFRLNDKYRETAKAFFESETGAAILYLLQNKAKVKPRVEAVPAEAVQDYSLAELSRLGGIQQSFDLITSLCLPPVTATTKQPVPQLGKHDEKDLPPEFKFTKPPQAETKS